MSLTFQYPEGCANFVINVSHFLGFFALVGVVYYSIRQSYLFCKHFQCLKKLTNTFHCRNINIPHIRNKYLHASVSSRAFRLIGYEGGVSEEERFDLPIMEHAVVGSKIMWQFGVNILPVQFSCCIDGALLLSLIRSAKSFEVVWHQPFLAFQHVLG